MDNGRKSISEIFSGNKYFSIPTYQRGYSWGDKQLLDFFDDFNTQYSSNNYYYGTVLLFDRDRKAEKEFFEIVDGQQRVTTLIIFISCMIKRMRELGYKEKQCDKLYENFVKDDEGFYILSLQSDDNDFFITKVLGNENVQTINTPSQRKLLNAKIKFSDWLSKCDNTQIDEFIHKIYGTNILVYLINSQVESAMIFETTNDRGKPLTNLEKTKSFLMYKACVLTDNTNQIINTLQNRFNQIYRDYEEIEEHFPDENAILQYSFIAYSRWGFSQKYKKEYQHYMEVMKDIIDNYIKKGDKKGLYDYIEKYSLQIQSAFETLKVMMKNPCNELKEVLAIGNVANFYPLLIKSYKYDSTSDKKNFSTICRLCEIFSFRVYVILKYLSNKAQTTWYNLARDFNGDFDKLCSQIIALIKEIDNDDKFIDKLNDKNFFNEYKSFEKNYLFWKYENWLRANEQPVSPPMPYSDLTEKVNKKLKMSIEHIVAQRNNNEKSRIVTKNLKIQVGQASKFDKDYLHSIGNLTIDPQSANSSKGNNDVLIKISKYFVRAPYKCQNELQDYLEKDEKWTILSIEKRREKIIGFAKKTWCDIGRFGIAKSKEAIEVIDSEED